MEKKYTILIVDDEHEFQKMLANRLEQRGFVVLKAYSCMEALSIIDSSNIDLVILDIAMPGIDGIEALKLIKKRRPETNVIMLTGQGSIQRGIEAMKLGALDFLEKPVDFNALLESISNSLQN